jgi:hypothetical protein
MSSLRFATAQALFDAFPEVVGKVGAAPTTDQSPIDFLKALIASNRLPDAVTFCAYLLPRREAVWWACKSTKILSDEILAEAPTLRAAEAWVYQPDEERRQAAVDLGTKGDTNDPTTWLALAVGWSSGLLAYGSPPPAYMTARAVRVAILTCLPKTPKRTRAERLTQCVLEGIRLAKAGL